MAGIFFINPGNELHRIRRVKDNAAQDMTHHSQNTTDFQVGGDRSSIVASEDFSGIEVDSGYHLVGGATQLRLAGVHSEGPVSINFEIARGLGFSFLPNPASFGTGAGCGEMEEVVDQEMGVGEDLRVDWDLVAEGDGALVKHEVNCR
jgi:hypothetical protein